VIFRELSSYSVGGDYLLSAGCQVFVPKARSHLKFIIKIFKKLKIYTRFFLTLFWNIDVSKLSKVSLIVVFDSSIEYYFCNHIEHFFSNKHLALYYWNNIDAVKEKDIEYFKNKTKWDIFSFDLEDSRKYDFKYNKIFSTVPENLLMMDNIAIKQDVFYIGADKGRIDQILEIKKRLDTAGFSNKILCVSFDTQKKSVYSDPVPYNEVLIEDIQSRAILDINHHDKYGMTMRELEALYMHKKLITNNEKITERDFYHENNIFIIDYSKMDFLEGLKEFMRKPFVPIDKNIIESYSVDAWLNRFFI
jgi:hypothetical protein